MNTAIDVKQLSVTLGNRHILHDINVSVPIGKITTLIAVFISYPSSIDIRRMAPQRMP